MKNCTIELIAPPLAEQVCRSITATLPEWFGIPEANERYALGMLERISFAALVNQDYAGLITLEFSYPNNGNIYWIAVKNNYHGQNIGTALIKAAEDYCRERGCNSLTVETLSPKKSDENYLKTYRFYEKFGFNPLFEMHTYDPENLMVYLQKTIGVKEVSKKESSMKKQLKPKLIKATIDNYPTMQNMARFYGYDMSRTCGFIEDWDWAFPKNGLYEGCEVKRYFEEKDRYAFLIKVGDELAGFILIHKKGISPNTDWNMGEFFIVAKFQGKGIGQQTAHQIWQQFPGRWEVAVIPENTPALAFWRRSVSDFTDEQYTEEIKEVYQNTRQPKRYILSFKSLMNSSSPE